MTLDYWLSEPLLIAATALVLIFGVGRLTRVITYDVFPPAVWWRMTWSKITNDGPWEKLFTCWWCLSFWIMLVAIGWLFLGFLVLWVWVAWWIFWGALGLSYVAAIVISRDTPPE